MVEEEEVSFFQYVYLCVSHTLLVEFIIKFLRSTFLFLFFFFFRERDKYLVPVCVFYMDKKYLYQASFSGKVNINTPTSNSTHQIPNLMKNYNAFSLQFTEILAPFLLLDLGLLGLAFKFSMSLFYNTSMFYQYIQVARQIMSQSMSLCLALTVIVIVIIVVHC